MNGSLHLLSESDEFHIITVRRYEGLGAHPPFHLLGDQQQLSVVVVRRHERTRECPTFLLLLLHLDWLGDCKKGYSYCPRYPLKDCVNVDRCVVMLRITKTNNWWYVIHVDVLHIKLIQM